MTDTPAPRSKRGSYSGTARRRAAIIQAASDVFAESGYRGGSMRDIAQRLGLGHTTLLHHFSTKSDLLEAVLTLRDEQGASTRRDDGDAADFMRWLIRLAERNQDTPGLVSLYCVLSAEATARDHPAHDYFQRRYALMTERLSSAIDSLATSGQLRRAVDPMAEARRIIALMDGLQLQWLFSAGALDMAATLRADLLGLVAIEL